MLMSNFEFLEGKKSELLVQISLKTILSFFFFFFLLYSLTGDNLRDTRSCATNLIRVQLIYGSLKCHDYLI